MPKHRSTGSIPNAREPRWGAGASCWGAPGAHLHHAERDDGGDAVLQREHLGPVARVQARPGHAQRDVQQRHRAEELYVRQHHAWQVPCACSLSGVSDVVKPAQATPQRDVQQRHRAEELYVRQHHAWQVPCACSLSGVSDVVKPAQATPQRDVQQRHRAEELYVRQHRARQVPCACSLSGVSDVVMPAQATPQCDVQQRHRAEELYVRQHHARQKPCARMPQQWQHDQRFPSRMRCAVHLYPLTSCHQPVNLSTGLCGELQNITLVPCTWDDPLVRLAQPGPLGYDTTQAAAKWHKA